MNALFARVLHRRFAFRHARGSPLTKEGFHINGNLYFCVYTIKTCRYFINTNKANCEIGFFEYRFHPSKVFAKLFAKSGKK